VGEAARRWSATGRASGCSSLGGAGAGESRWRLVDGGDGLAEGRVDGREQRAGVVARHHVTGGSAGSHARVEHDPSRDSSIP
jgi:hypothetical protein